MRRRGYRAVRRFWRDHLTLCWNILWDRSEPYAPFAERAHIVWEQLHVTPRAMLAAYRNRRQIHREAMENLLRAIFGEGEPSA